MNHFFKEIDLFPARWRYFLIMLICLPIIVLFYWQDILPLRQELLTIQQQEQQLTSELQKLYNQENSLEGKMAELPQTRTLLNEWQKKFIKFGDIDKLLREIIAISKRNKLIIKLFDAEAVIQESSYVKQPFKIALVGDYKHTTQFIEQMASLPWTVVIGNFSLVKTSSDEYTTDLEFYVYYFKNTSPESPGLK